MENDPKNTEAEGSANRETIADREMSEEEKPVRSVRMRWGRPIEEPAEETAEEIPVEMPAAEAHVPEEPKEPPKPDPRIEALRVKLEQQEKRQRAVQQASAEAAKCETSAVRSTSEQTPAETRRPTPEELHAMRMREEARRRAAERERREREEETARLRYELEREELRKQLRKKRRRESIRRGVLAFFGGIVSLIRSIRITKKQVLAIASTLVLAVTVTVILGNLLKNRVGADGEKETSSGESTTAAETVPYFRDMEIPELGAGIVSLEGATAQSLRSEASRFAASGVSAVSLILRNADGNLLFSARTDGALGMETGEAELLTIGEVLEPFLARDLYVSCLLPMRYDKDGDSYSRSVLYAYESALLCEVAEAGADEVILLDADGAFVTDPKESGDGTERAADAVAELCDMASAVHGRAPETAVGIAFTPEFLASRESDRYLSDIATAFDLSLLDLRGHAADDDVYAAISAGVSEHLYFILRYSMRVLIPAGSAEAVLAEEINNWQEGTLPIILPEETGN